MDAYELLKAAPEIQNIAALIVGGVPVAEIVRRIVLPSADVLGKRMTDRVEPCFGKAAKMIEDAGAAPQPVEDKLVVEILRGASLEENEDLHTIWAALWANAASPENASKVRPGFAAILPEMAPDEAKLLKWINDHSQGWTPHVGGLNWSQAQVELGFTSKAEVVRNRRIDSRKATCLDGLEAQQLIRRTYCLPSSGSRLDESSKFGLKEVDWNLTLTERGDEVLNACEPPKAND